jgi:hypothetical protein
MAGDARIHGRGSADHRVAIADQALAVPSPLIERNPMCREADALFESVERECERKQAAES